MNSGAHQKIVHNLKRSMVPVRICTALIIFVLTKYGIMSLYIGLLLTGILSIESTIKLYATKSYVGQNFMNFCLSVSPIWLLYLDPCEMVFAQTLSLTNMRNLVLEENRKKHRIFFSVLAIASWVTIIFFGGSFLDECPKRMTDHLRKDAIVILVAVVFFISALTTQINAILCELKDSFAAVKELNSKLEVLNKELQQSLDDKDNFILLFSHETRNPLNILIGNLTLLLGEVGNTQYKIKLERCKFCADLLLQQLNNILDSGKLSNRGNLELSPTSVNLNTYIQSITSFMEMLIKKKGTVKSELIIPESLPINLKFDMQRFTQVCLNLLTNALKFTDSGFLSLVIRYIRKDVVQESDYYPSTDFGYRLLCSSETKITAQVAHEIEEESITDVQIGKKRQFTREIANLGNKKKTFIGVDFPEKGFLKIEINDTGCGIKPEDMKKLFHKFSQTHSDTAQLQVGSGLGLWITKTLCGLMGGDVRAYSVTNVGSSFVAIIQADCLPSSRPRFGTSQLSPSLPDSGSLRESETKRILLVDDDPFNLEFHSHIIMSLGYKSIETAIDGQKLVEQFKKRPEGYFEAIVTDIAMPNLNGIEAAKLVRKFEEDNRRAVQVKIGFITGHSNHKDKLICENAPLNCLFYLSKPIKAAIIESFLPSLTSSLYLSPKNLEVPSPKRVVHSNILTYKPILLPSSSPLILCVEDDLFNLDFLEEILRSLGARTVRAQSGEESLNIIKSAISKNMKEDIPKLVLMDCRMPKMDGWEASKLIRELLKRELGMSVPIVGISGDDKDQNQEKLKASEIDEILQKPIQKDELQRLISKYT